MSSVVIGLHALARWFRRWRGLRVHEGKLRDAQQARAEALRAAQDAAQRGDDRDYGRAMMLVRQATHDELRAGR